MTWRPRLAARRLSQNWPRPQGRPRSGSSSCSASTVTRRSVNMKVGEDGCALRDFGAGASAEDAFTAVDTSDRLARLLTCLSGGSARSCPWRYGLGGRRPQALEDVGRLRGSSRASVGNIEHVALAKLRKAAGVSIETLPTAVQGDERSMGPAGLGHCAGTSSVAGASKGLGTCLPTQVRTST